MTTTGLAHKITDSPLDQAALKDLLAKKVLTPAAMRETVAHLQAFHGMNERRLS